MTATNTELLIRIRADLGQVIDDLNRVSGGVNGVGNASHQATARISALNSTTAALNSTMAAFGVTLGVVGFAGLLRDILRTNIEMETLRGRLTGLAGSAAEGAKNFEFILKFAKETPFEIDGITKAYLTLQNFGLKPTAEVMEALTNQSARSGASAENLTGIAVALGQAWGKGKLQGQEILQLINQSVPIYDLLTKVTGKNSAALFDMAEKGDITRDVIDKVIKEMGKAASGQNAIAMETLKGRISVLSDAWGHFEDTLMQDKSEGLIKTISDSITHTLDMLSRNMSTTLTDQLAHAEARLKTFNSMNTVAKGATQTIGFIGSGEIYDAKAAAMEIAVMKDKLRAENAQKDKQAIDEKAKHEKEMAGTQDVIKKDEAAKETVKVLADLTDANKKLTLSHHDYTKQLLEQKGLSGVALQKALDLSDANEKLSQSHKDAAKALTAQNREAKQADKAYANEREAIAKNIEQLNFELSVLKKSDEERAILTKIRSLSAKAIPEETKEIEKKVRALDKETTALQRQKAMWDQLVQDANARDKLLKDNKEFILHGDVQSGFNERLAAVQDQLDAGTIKAEEAKAEYDKLGKAYNEYFIKPAESGTGSLSEFSIQAARNMQDAFADFLFDPFADGLEGMGVNFAKIVQRMAANAAAAKIFEALLGENFGKSDATGGVLGALFSAAGSAVGSYFSGGASATMTMSGGPGWFPSANGNAFDHGRLLAFANGGVVNRATTFPMADGQTGLMAEAGPEAIMPLKRNANGQLGVVSTGGSDFHITTQVNVTSNGGGTGDGADMGNKLGNMVNAAVRQVIVTEKRPGGLLASS